MLVPLFVLTTLGIYYLVKDIFHPAFMLMFFWTLGFVSLSILPGFYFPSLETQVIIFSYLFIFTLVSLTISFMMRTNILDKYLVHIPIERKTLFFVSFVLSIGLILYLVRYIEVIRSFDSLAEYFYRIRYAAIHANEPLITTGALLTQVKTFSSIFSLVLMYEVYRNNLSKYYKLYLMVFISLTLGANIIEGARNEFVLLLLAYVALYVYLNGSKSIFKSVFIFLFLFFVLSIFTRGVGSDSLLEALIKFFEHIVMYAFGSIISFGTFLEDGNIQIFSSIMIKIVNKLNTILDIFALNIKLHHPELQQTDFAYISDDMRTNVYSFLSVRISYFGFLGAALSIAVHAAIITVVYKFKNTSIYMFILYLLMIPTTILTLFHEYFFAMIPYYIRAIVLVFVLYYLKPYQLLVKFLRREQKCAVS